MTSVLVLGQPYWASRVVHVVNAHAPDMRARFVPPREYLHLLARPPRSEGVILVRAGFRAGAATPRGRAFDTYWALLRRALPSASICHYWLGTDVMNTLEEARAGTLRRDTLLGTRDDLHLTDADWLTSELGTVGVTATTAHIPSDYGIPVAAPPLPQELSIITYLPGSRFDFFGGAVTLEAARRLPDVRFDIVGRQDGPPRPAPANVRWLGWVADMASCYATATAVVRIPLHDGLGATVIEGLLNARHVIYTHEMPFVRRIWPPTADALTEEVDRLRSEHAAGRLALNLEGRAYAISQFDAAKLGVHMVAQLRGIL